MRAFEQFDTLCWVENKLKKNQIYDQNHVVGLGVGTRICHYIHSNAHIWTILSITFGKPCNVSDELFSDLSSRNIYSYVRANNTFHAIWKESMVIAWKLNELWPKITNPAPIDAIYVFLNQNRIAAMIGYSATERAVMRSARKCLLAAYMRNYVAMANPTMNYFSICHRVVFTHMCSQIWHFRQFGRDRWS